MSSTHRPLKGLLRGMSRRGALRGRDRGHPHVLSPTNHLLRTSQSLSSTRLKRGNRPASVVRGIRFQSSAQGYAPPSAPRKDHPVFFSIAIVVLVSIIYFRFPHIFGRDVDEEPEEPLDWTTGMQPMLEYKAAIKKLNKEQKSRSFKEGQAGLVSRFDIVRVPSNSPTEDNYVYQVQGVGKDKDWHFWGVFDGHLGWQMSSVLRLSLAAYVARELSKPLIYGSETSSDIDRAIKAAFLQLDGDISSHALDAVRDLTIPHGEALSRITLASSGSCALLAMYDPPESTLRVACVGDSRAVLGQKTADAQWTCVPMSEDQTGFNKTELDRITAEHPDEEPIDLKSGRVLGLAVTRAFGDNLWKWPVEKLEALENRFFGRRPRPKYLSPPYLTAEPVVKTQKVSKGDFLILASDGLWDHISSEDAVKCIGAWIETVQELKGDKTQLSKKVRPPRDIGDRSLKAEGGYSADWKVTPENFVVESNNAAAHLARNALGGRDKELFRSVMSTQPPYSRDARDDITVTVVFFGDV